MIFGSVSVNAATNTDPDLVTRFVANIFDMDYDGEFADLVSLYSEIDDVSGLTDAYEAAFSGLAASQQDRLADMNIMLDSVSDFAGFIEDLSLADPSSTAETVAAHIDGGDDTALYDMIMTKEETFRTLMAPYDLDELDLGFDRLDEVFAYQSAFATMGYTLCTISTTGEMAVNEDDVSDAVALANTLLNNDIESTTELIAGLGDFAAFYNNAGSGDQAVLETYLTGLELVTVETTSGGGGGGGGLIVPEPEAPTVVSSDEVIAAVSQAVKGTAVFEISESADVKELTLPLDALQGYEKDSNDALRKIEVKSAIGSVTFDVKSIMGTDAAGATNEVPEGTTVKVAMKTVDTSTLTGVPEGAVVVDFGFILTDAEGIETEITSFAKPIKVGVPYTPAEGENTNFVTVYYVSADGEIVPVGGHYNPATGMVDFWTNHFSMYYAAAGTKTFGDVPETHWAYEYVSSFAGKGFINGVGNDMFLPSTDITRAEFVAIVTRMYKLMGDVDASPFEDVPADVWYAEAVAAAYEAGIINGTSATTFAPMAKITRQEAAVIVANALALQDIVVEEDSTLISDAFQRFRCDCWLGCECGGNGL